MRHLRRALARHLRTLAYRLDPPARTAPVRVVDEMALLDAIDARYKQAVADAHVRAGVEPPEYGIPAGWTPPPKSTLAVNNTGRWQPVGRPHRPSGGIR